MNPNLISNAPLLFPDLSSSHHHRNPYLSPEDVDAFESRYFPWTQAPSPHHSVDTSASTLPNYFSGTPLPSSFLADKPEYLRNIENPFESFSSPPRAIFGRGSSTLTPSGSSPNTPRVQADRLPSTDDGVIHDPMFGPGRIYNIPAKTNLMIIPTGFNTPNVIANFFIPVGFSLALPQTPPRPPYTFIAPLNISQLLRNGQINIVYDNGVRNIVRPSAGPANVNAVSSMPPPVYNGSSDPNPDPPNSQSSSSCSTDSSNVLDTHGSPSGVDSSNTASNLSSGRSSGSSGIRDPLYIHSPGEPHRTPHMSTGGTKKSSGRKYTSGSGLGRRVRRMQIRFNALQLNWGQTWLDAKRRFARLIDVELHGSDAVNINLAKLNIWTTQLESIKPSNRTEAKETFMEKLSTIESETSPVVTQLPSIDVQPLSQTIPLQHVVDSKDDDHKHDTSSVDTSVVSDPINIQPDGADEESLDLLQRLQALNLTWPPDVLQRIFTRISHIRLPASTAWVQRLEQATPIERQQQMEEYVRVFVALDTIQEPMSDTN